MNRLLRISKCALLCAASVAATGCPDSAQPPVDATAGTIDSGEATDAPPVTPDAMPPDANNNAAPTASFTITPDCTMSNTTQITFASTSTDPEDDPLTCSWTFLSGTPSSSTDCTQTGVTFPNAAPYNVTLTVNDGNGGTNQTTMQIAPCVGTD